MSVDHISHRPILYDYFKRSADVLLAEYERSKCQEASANIGQNRELFCNKFLSHVLPTRLRVRCGEIWDSRGSRTGQLDVIVIRDDCPSLTFGEADTFLVEGVFAVIEVKSELTTAKLEDAMTSLRHVKSLSISRGITRISSGPVLDRPLRCVFAYEGATWETLIKELTKPENFGVADLVCILNRGALVSRGLLLSWQNGRPFSVYQGRAASLAWLYFHLVIYSSSFVGRSLGQGILEYFEPLDGWVDGSSILEGSTPP